MSKNSPAPLTLPVIPKKGQAVSALRSIEAPAAPPADRSAASTPDSFPLPRSSRVKATIAVTVRLDEPRYERLKGISLSQRITNQDIIVAALDRLFAALEKESQ